MYYKNNGAAAKQKCSKYMVITPSPLFLSFKEIILHYPRFQMFIYCQVIGKAPLQYTQTLKTLSTSLLFKK